MKKRLDYQNRTDLFRCQKTHKHKLTTTATIYFVAKYIHNHNKKERHRKEQF